ncbi:MAG: terminase large subunit domain-containing protein [Erysipelotrichaceae bacterium]
MKEEILIENSDIKNSLEYKIALFKKVILELRSRQKYPYYNYTPNSARSYLLHECCSKIIIAKGAPRSGKTWAVIEDVLMNILGEHPFNHRHDKAKEKICWVVGSSFGKIDETLFPMFKSILPMNRVRRIRENPKDNIYQIEFDNDWRMIFKSQKQATLDFASASVNIILVDERIVDEDLRTELRTRIFSTDGQLYYTMDSRQNDDWINELKNFSYVSIFEYELTDNINNLPKEEFERAKNDFDEMQKEMLFYGRSVEKGIDYLFDDNSIWNDENYVPVIPECYDITIIDSKAELIPKSDGILKIFVPKQSGRKYLAGLDMAGGKGGTRNCHGVQIFDEYGEQVARILNNNIHYTVFTEQYVYPLLLYYNRALLIPENKSYGEWAVDTIKGIYNNIYCDYLLASHFNKNLNIEYGIKTDETNKGNMTLTTLGDLKANRFIIHDEKTYKQLKVFCQDSKDRGTQKSNYKYYGKKIRDDEELKVSEDDLVLAFLFVDRAMNKLKYFNKARPDRNNMLTLDDIKKKEIKIYTANDENGIDPYYSVGNPVKYSGVY